MACGFVLLYEGEVKLMLIILLITLIILLVISYFLCGKDILAPSVLTCAVYIISILFAIINIEYWGINYSPKTFIIMLIGILCFVIPGIMLYKKNNNNEVLFGKFFSEEYLIKPDKKIVFFLLIIDLIITFFYIKEVYRISIIGGNNIGYLGMASYYRSYTAMSNESEQISTLLSQFLKISRALGFVSIFILSYNSQIKKCFKRDIVLWIFVLITIIQNILGGGRGVMLWLAGTAFASMYISNMSKYEWKKRINFKYIKNGIKIFVVILIAFYGLKYFIRLGNTVDSFLNYISYYAGGSIENFNLYIKNPPVDSHLLYGQETFMGIYKTLEKFNLIDIGNVYSQNGNLEMRFSNTGVVLGNVYGAIRRYYNDFGIHGVVFLQFICSIFYNVFYNRIKKKKIRDFKWGILFYSYLLYHIFQIAIDDTFFKSFLSFNMLTSFIILYIVYYILVKVKWKRNKIILGENDDS